MGDATMIEDVLDLTVRKQIHHLSSSRDVMTSLRTSPVPVSETCSELYVNDRRPAHIDRASSPSSASSGKVTWCSPSPRNSDVPDTRVPSDGDTISRRTTSCRSPSQTSDYEDDVDENSDRDEHRVAGSSPKYRHHEHQANCSAETPGLLPSMGEDHPKRTSEKRHGAPLSAVEEFAGRCSPSTMIPPINAVKHIQPFNSMTSFLPQAAAAAAASLPFNLNRLLAFQQLCAGGQLPLVSASLSSALHGSYPTISAAGSPRSTAVTPVISGTAVGRSTGSLCSSSPSSTTAGDYFWPVGESTPQRKRKRATSNETKRAVAGPTSGVSVGDLSGADSNSSDLASQHASFPGQSASMTPSYHRRTSSEWQPVDDTASIHGGAGSMGEDSLHGADPSYIERRRKNNEAAKRSRDARRNKERETATRAATLEQENLRLKAELAVLRAEAAKLQSMLFSRF